MISSYRALFNRNFSPEKYTELLLALEKGLVEIPFRIAETPVFLPNDLKNKLVAAGATLIDFIKNTDFKTLTEASIPKQWNVPNENDHPHFLTFDFGICRDENSELVPKLIEVQGFPSLYGFQLHLANIYKDVFKLPLNLSPLFGDMNEASYITLLKEVIIGQHEPHEVGLMDINVHHQKTAIDFQITAKYLGLKILSLTDIKQDGKSLYYIHENRKVTLKRIYNRLLFDEVGENRDVFSNSFDPRNELDIEWISHPNWFYRISKYIMPFIKEDFVPETQFLDKLTDIPRDLENYVLKPLFSFAGQGVIIDLKESDIDGIAEPKNWILQKKVTYAPVVQAPNGLVKAEVRLMYIWPDGKEPVLCINLVRLSKGKMIGVNYNRDFDWVGGSVGLMEQ